MASVDWLCGCHELGNVPPVHAHEVKGARRVKPMPRHRACWRGSGRNPRTTCPRPPWRIRNTSSCRAASARASGSRNAKSARQPAIRRAMSVGAASIAAQQLVVAEHPQIAGLADCQAFTHLGSILSSGSASARQNRFEADRSRPARSRGWRHQAPPRSTDPANSGISIARRSRSHPAFSAILLSAIARARRFAGESPATTMTGTCLETE